MQNNLGGGGGGGRVMLAGGGDNERFGDGDDNGKTVTVDVDVILEKVTDFSSKNFYFFKDLKFKQNYEIRPF